MFYAVTTDQLNCFALAGGPLFTKSSSGDWVQLGLVSWGPTNEQKADRTWDVNSDVSFYKTWINEHIALYVFSTIWTRDMNTSSAINLIWIEFV